MFLHTPIPRILAITALISASLYFAIEIHHNQQTAQQLSTTIAHTARALAAEKHAQSQQQRGPDQQEPTASLELEALGIKLKMVEEATWSSIIKLCAVWMFALITALGYRWAQHRLGIADK